jgi:glycerol-3-phosphate dehydrogenase (NAD(P)+)
MKRIAIIGAGSWGTALAVMAAHAGHEIKLWSRNDEVVHSINKRRVNSRYLTPVEIPAGVVATNELDAALRDADHVLFAAPSHAARELFTAIAPQLPAAAIIVSVAKGIEIETGKRISEVVKEVVGGDQSFVCLSGPSFAKEVVAGHPTAIVAASKDAAAARAVQNDLSFENLRIYTNADVIGTEIGGSVKKVMAIAAGIAA